MSEINVALRDSFITYPDAWRLDRFKKKSKGGHSHEVANTVLFCKGSFRDAVPVEKVRDTVKRYVNDTIDYKEGFISRYTTSTPDGKTSVSYRFMSGMLEKPSQEGKRIGKYKFDYDYFSVEEFTENSMYGNAREHMTKYYYGLDSLLYRKEVYDEGITHPGNQHIYRYTYKKIGTRYFPDSIYWEDYSTINAPGYPFSFGFTIYSYSTDKIGRLAGYQINTSRYGLPVRKHVPVQLHDTILEFQQKKVSSFSFYDDLIFITQFDSSQNISHILADAGFYNNKITTQYWFDKYERVCQRITTSGANKYSAELFTYKSKNKNDFECTYLYKDSSSNSIGCSVREEFMTRELYDFRYNGGRITDMQLREQVFGLNNFSDMIYYAQTFYKYY